MKHVVLAVVATGMLAADSLAGFPRLGRRRARQAPHQTVRVVQPKPAVQLAKPADQSAKLRDVPRGPAAIAWAEAAIAKREANPNAESAKAITRIYAEALLRGTAEEKTVAKTSLVKILEREVPGLVEQDAPGGYAAMSPMELFIFFCRVSRHASNEALFEQAPRLGDTRDAFVGTLVWQELLDPILLQERWIDRLDFPDDGFASESLFFARLRFSEHLAKREYQREIREIAHAFVRVRQSEVAWSILGQYWTCIDDVLWMRVPDEYDLTILWQSIDRMKQMTVPSMRALFKQLSPNEIAALPPNSPEETKELRNYLLSTYFRAAHKRGASTTSRLQALSVLREKDEETATDAALVLRGSPSLPQDALQILTELSESGDLEAATTLVAYDRKAFAKHIVVLEEAVLEDRRDTGWFEVLLDTNEDESRAVRAVERVINDSPGSTIYRLGDPESNEVIRVKSGNLLQGAAVDAAFKRWERSAEYVRILKSAMNSKLAPVNVEATVRAARALAQIPGSKEIGLNQLVAWATVRIEDEGLEDREADPESELLDSLARNDARNRQYDALAELGALGKQAHAARPALAKFLLEVLRRCEEESRDTLPRFMDKLIRALGDLGGDVSREALLSALDVVPRLKLRSDQEFGLAFSQPSMLELEIVHALRHAGVDVPRTIAKLCTLLKSKSPLVRLAVVQALRSSRENNPLVREALLEVAKREPYKRIRNEAAEAVELATPSTTIKR